MHSSSLDEMEFDPIPQVIEAFKDGQFVVVMDEPDRENEADLIIAAQDMTTDKMAFMIRHSSGFVCAPLSATRAESLELPQMVEHNTDTWGTAYTISVDSADSSVTTGISAHDRALTCQTLADPAASPASFRRPGHVIPLRARPGGVLARRGHTEAAVELCCLAEKEPAAVLCEMVDDGDAVSGQAIRTGAGMLRGKQCIVFARTWDLKVCTVRDLVQFVRA